MWKVDGRKFGSDEDGPMIGSLTGMNIEYCVLVGFASISTIFGLVWACQDLPNLSREKFLKDTPKHHYLRWEGLDGLDRPKGCLKYIMAKNPYFGDFCPFYRFGLL